jgi:ring-1,2-phenylacetyl-CoA epoxidase subunit PaaD
VAATACIPLLPLEEHERRQRRANSALQPLWDLLDAVVDPEIPVVSLWQLGVLQDIALEDGIVVVTITPTYSGCPAMTVMAEDVQQALADAGYPHSRIVTKLSPAWSTSWMADDAREKLRAYGIAPPGENEAAPVLCPRCGSVRVRTVSQFGSTACKALYQCGDCAEPFDYFKSI